MSIQGRYKDAVVIGICGRPGSGKDTVSIVLDRCGFRSVTLKKPIEEAVKVVLLADDFHMYDRKAREELLPDWEGWTVRKALQAFGQSVREIIGPEVWAKNLCLRIDRELESEASSCHKSMKRFHVADVRTPDDLSVIKTHVEAGGGRFFMLMVKRPGYGSTTTGGFANHILESYDLEEHCDTVFENDGTIPELHSKVEAWLKSKDIHDVAFEEDKRLFDAIRDVLKPTSSDLDPLPQSERSKFCWCKPDQNHCGICDCGRPGHIRSLGPATFAFCDSCYRDAAFLVSKLSQEEAKA